MGRFNEYIKTIIEQSDWVGENGELLFVEPRGEGYYAYTDTYDKHFKDEKELKDYLKKNGFEYIGGE